MPKKYLFIILLPILAGLSFFIFWWQKSKNIDIPYLLIHPASFLLPSSSTPFKTSLKHVFLILEENKDWLTIYQNPDAPYLNSLLSQGAYASNYHNIPTNMGDLHPSELNYIFLQTGMISFPDHTFTTDDNPSAENATASQNTLTTLLTQKGYTWKSYQEDISGNDCPIDSVDSYSPKHNPFVYFKSISGNPPNSSNAYCQQHIRPLSELSSDLASGDVPNYVFITPNLQNDMHDGSVTQADTWLSQTVPQITSSATFKNDGVLFITWDEGSDENGSNTTGGNNPIGMIILSPFVKKGYTNTTEYSHMSLLKTIEEIFHLSPLLGDAESINTKDLFDFFTFNK